MSKQDISKETRRRIVADFDRGIAIKVIAEDYGLTRPTIYKALKRAHRLGPDGMKPPPAQVYELLSSPEERDARERHRRNRIEGNIDTLIDAVGHLAHKIEMASNPGNDGSFTPTDIKNLSQALVNVRGEVEHARRLVDEMTPQEEEEHRPADLDSYPIPEPPDGTPQESAQ